MLVDRTIFKKYYDKKETIMAVKTLSDVSANGSCYVCSNLISFDNKGNYRCNQCGHTDNWNVELDTSSVSKCIKCNKPAQVLDDKTPYCAKHYKTKWAKKNI